MCYLAESFDTGCPSRDNPVFMIRIVECFFSSNQSKNNTKTDKLQKFTFISGYISSQ